MSTLRPSLVDKLVCRIRGHNFSKYYSLNTGKRHCFRCGTYDCTVDLIENLKKEVEQ